MQAWWKTPVGWLDEVSWWKPANPKTVATPFRRYGEPSYRWDSASFNDLWLAQVCRHRFVSIFLVMQLDHRIIGTVGRRSFSQFAEMNHFRGARSSQEGLPHGGQGRQNPIVVIPESPHLSLFDDCGVGLDSEFVSATPALEPRVFIRNSG